MNRAYNEQERRGRYSTDMSLGVRGWGGWGPMDQHN